MFSLKQARREDTIVVLSIAAIVIVLHVIGVIVPSFGEILRMSANLLLP